jgi:hypothetical protein
MQSHRNGRAIGSRQVQVRRAVVALGVVMVTAAALFAA